VLFGQFKEDDQVVTTDFVLDVAPAPVPQQQPENLDAGRYLLLGIAAIIAAALVCLYFFTRKRSV
jgi:hypothetical protein